jgi:hypothetical protein
MFIGALGSPLLSFVAHVTMLFVIPRTLEVAAIYLSLCFLTDRIYDFLRVVPPVTSGHGSTLLYSLIVVAVNAVPLALIGGTIGFFIHFFKFKGTKPNS